MYLSFTESEILVSVAFQKNSVTEGKDELLNKLCLALRYTEDHTLAYYTAQLIAKLQGQSEKSVLTLLENIKNIENDRPEPKFNSLRGVRL